MRLAGDAATTLRYAMLLKLPAEGKSQLAIAPLTQCSQVWVSKVLARARDEHTTTLSKAKQKVMFLVFH